jgi:hypothetical protein
MERRTKDCRNNSCLDRPLLRDKNQNLTSSFIEQSKMDSINSSIESIQKHSNKLYKVKIILINHNLFNYI